MRILFPNATRPKNAAKKIAVLLSVPLSSAQSAVAVACGYADWHDLERTGFAAPSSPLDEDIDDKDFIDRQICLILRMAKTLSCPVGDAQYALSLAHLTGNRPRRLSDQIEIRLRCFRETDLPVPGRRQPGAVGRLKAKGFTGQPGILCRFGRGVQLVVDSSIMTAADFEYVEPRSPAPLFLPLRLYLPYGVWTLDDGSEVVFSRDYFPMWRISRDGNVERALPWIWVSSIQKQQYFWEDANTPWDEPSVKAQMERFLDEKKLSGLPILADALSLLVLNEADDRHKRMAMAARYLAEARGAEQPWRPFGAELP